MGNQGTKDVSVEELDAWEVNLCHSLVSESPGDESLAVAAPDRDTAVNEARRVSSNNPPKVGPVYNEGDNVPLDACDNWPSVKETILSE